MKNNAWANIYSAFKATTSAKKQDNYVCQRDEGNAKRSCFSQTTAQDYICDEYFEKNDVRMERGIKGLTSGVFMQNFHNQYYDQVRLSILLVCQRAVGRVD